MSFILKPSLRTEQLFAIVDLVAGIPRNQLFGNDLLYFYLISTQHNAANILQTFEILAATTAPLQ